MNWPRGGGGVVRRISCCWLLLFLLVSCCVLHSCQADDTDEEKAPPGKGEGCASLELIDLNLFINPCDPLIDQEIPIHAFDYTLYAALPPFTSGYFIPIAFLIVNFLDYSIPQYQIRIPLDEIGFLEYLDALFTYQKVIDKSNVIAKVTLINAGVDIIQKSQYSWWWEYRFVFGCEYGTLLPDKTPGDPITNTNLKQDIRDAIDKEIQTLGYIMQVLNIYENSRGVLGWAINDPRVTTAPPFVFERPERRNNGPIRVPQPSSSNTTLPHSVSSWDWRSAVGVILWIVVVVVFSTITHLAGIRHLQRYKMDLTTPDGVEALLDVRWRQEQDDDDGTGGAIHIYHRRAHQVYKRAPPPSPIYEEYYGEEELLVRDGGTEFV